MNDIHYIETRNKNIQYNESQHNNIQYSTLSMITLRINDIQHDDTIGSDISIKSLKRKT
jgi:hypothetical protein